MQNSDCEIENRHLVYGCDLWGKKTREIAFCTRGQQSHVLQSYIFHKNFAVELWS